MLKKESTATALSKVQDRRTTFSLTSPMAMTNMAKLLKAHIIKHGLYTEIQKKNYAHVEGWQFAGGMLGIFPRVVAVTDLSDVGEIIWQAEVELFSLKDGKVISRGFAVCSNKENSKKGFQEYAILSMAQTRAIGKAYRNCIGWVMKLAQMESTPAEEMHYESEEKPKVNYKVSKKADPLEHFDDVIDGSQTQ